MQTAQDWEMLHVIHYVLVSSVTHSEINFNVEDFPVQKIAVLEQGVE